MARFRVMLKEAGRDASTCPITLVGCPDDADTLKRYRDHGVARACVILPPAKGDTVLPILDTWAGLIRQVSD
jgi:hypothetical protein